MVVRFATIALVLSACGFKRPPDIGPAQLQVTAGDGQTGIAGTPLSAALIVTVLDTDNAPLTGANVAFSATAGGGSLDATATTTDETGEAQVTLTLGRTSGANIVVASVEGLAPVTFTATGVAGPAARLVVSAGNAQTGAAGETLAAPLVVVAEDMNSNPVSGVAVTFAVTAGGGEVSTPQAVTDASGHADTTLTMGTGVGTNTVEASATGLSPVTFSATAAAGAPASITIASGDQQQADAGTPLPDPLVVTVTDAHGNPTPGVMVAFSATAGGGTASSPTALTDMSGMAMVSFVLGPRVGANTIEAHVGGESVDFIATGLTGPAKQLVAISGDGQRTIAGTELGKPLVVAVEDAFGNPVSDVNVTYAVTSGGGSVSSPSSTTDASGRAATTWTLGNGSTTPQTLTASASGLGAANFTATILAAESTTNFTASSSVLATGDFNGDGLPDVAVGNGSLFANTTATDATTPSFSNSTGPGASTFAVADFNADGKQDVVTVATGGGQTSLAVDINTTAAGSTSLTFSSSSIDIGGASMASTMTGPTLAAADFNQDGRIDLAMLAVDPMTHAGEVLVLLNQTTPGSTAATFNAPKAIATFKSAPTMLAASDLDGNGEPDLVVAKNPDGTSAQSVVFALINGTPSGGSTLVFAAPSGLVGYPTCAARPTGLAVGDINSDHRPDVVVACTNPASMPNGGLETVLATATGFGPPSGTVLSFNLASSGVPPLVLADVDGDGRPDVVSSDSSGAVQVLLDRTGQGAAAATFTMSLAMPAGTGGVAAADFNMDGKLDLAVADSNSGHFTVILMQ